MKYLIRQWIEVLHANEQCPRLMVDATVLGVSVPERVKAEWGQAMPIDLDPSFPLELRFEEAGICCCLSFGAPFECFFPWESIYVVQEKETRIGIVVEENLPERLRGRGEDGRLRPAVGGLPVQLRPSRATMHAGPPPAALTGGAPTPTPAGGRPVAPIPVALAETPAQPSERDGGSRSPGVTVQESPEVRRARFRIVDGGRSNDE